MLNFMVYDFVGMRNWFIALSLNSKSSKLESKHL
jgi:predicted glycosyltransferase involved in capsule biosynthesis